MTPNQLFDDRYAPITSEIGFLKCEAQTASDAFQEWHRPIQSGRGVRLVRQEVVGDFQTKIASLLPLTSVEARRYLFSPTKSDWTVYLDNGWRGTDVYAVVSYLSTTIRCEGIRAVCVPDTRRKGPTGMLGRYGATMLEVYAADSSGCSFLNTRRSISASNDGGRWRFDAAGEQLDFEQTERYDARKIRDRFTPAMLQEYVGAFGIQLFSPEFYNVAEAGYLISKEGPTARDLEQYSLDEARATF